MGLQRKSKVARDNQVEVSITSLIDMTFLLLIFFVSIQQVATMELAADLKLPLASQGNPELEQERDRLIVNVDQGGDIYIARTRITRNELKNVLLREAARSRDAEGFANRPVFIRADGDLAFGIVQDVLITCRDARVWKLSLRISQPKEAGR